MKVKAIQAYYVGEGNFFNKLIRWRQWLSKGTRPYSHITHTELIINGQWYSSSHMDGGVRRMRHRPNPKNWDYAVVDIDYQDAMRVYRSHKSKGYDWLGILFSQALKLGVHSKKRMFCSEVNAGQRGLESSHEYSPAKLASVDKYDIRQGLTMDVVRQYAQSPHQ